jgi:S-phase kinase-associated protein 1
MYTVFAGTERERFEVPEPVLKHSECIKNMMQDTNDTEIPFENIDPKTMSLILQFCWFLTEKNENSKKYSKDQQMSEKEEEEEEKKRKITSFEEAFMEDLDAQKKLFDVTIATNFLNIEYLLDVCTKHIARKIVGKTPEEVREEFGIVNDFTPEEEEQIKKENSWMISSIDEKNIHTR